MKQFAGLVHLKTCWLHGLPDLLASAALHQLFETWAKGSARLLWSRFLAPVMVVLSLWQELKYRDRGAVPDFAHNHLSLSRMQLPGPDQLSAASP